MTDFQMLAVKNMWVTGFDAGRIGAQANADTLAGFMRVIYLQGYSAGVACRTSVYERLVAKGDSCGGVLA